MAHSQSLLDRLADWDAGNQFDSFGNCDVTYVYVYGVPLTLINALRVK